MLVYFLVCLLSGFAGYAFIIWTEHKVMQKLQTLKRIMDERTQQVHAEFKRALLALAICPLVGT